MSDVFAALSARLAAESIWAERIACSWCCAKHVVVVGFVVLALVSCQSWHASPQWQLARVVAVLPPEAAAAAAPCGAVAAVKVSYYQGGTVFHAVRPTADVSLSRGQWVRFDLGTPCGLVEMTGDR